MKNSLLAVAAMFFALSVGTGCSTMGNFKIPADTTLRVTDRDVKPDAEGNWKTSPFFWTEAGGVHYTLMDSGGKVVRSGKLKANFRVVSIFWPPLAIIYWPMGFAKGEFDLTKPGDGYMVKDDMMAPGATSVMPAKTTSESPAAVPAETPKKKKKAKAPPANP